MRTIRTFAGGASYSPARRPAYPIGTHRYRRLPGGVLGLGPFYGGVVNAMRVVHYVATVGGGLFLIVHVYLGTVAYPGTLGAMPTGSVSADGRSSIIRAGKRKSRAAEEP